MNVLNSLEYIPKSKITGLYDNSMFNLFWNCQTFSISWLHHFTFLPVCEGSNFSTPSSTLVIICLFDYSHPIGVKWYLIVVFFAFP